MNKNMTWERIGAHTWICSFHDCFYEINVNGYGYDLYHYGIGYIGKDYLTLKSAKDAARRYANTLL